MRNGLRPKSHRQISNYTIPFFVFGAFCDDDDFLDHPSDGHLLPDQKEPWHWFSEPEPVFGVASDCTDIVRENNAVVESSIFKYPFVAKGPEAGILCAEKVELGKSAANPVYYSVGEILVC